MKRCIPFEQIIKANSDRPAVQGDWERQRKTARAIVQRFDNGHDAVLLADEVGMGKTYVALAVMADYLLQSDRNDRKVLLVTPPSHVLKHKWIEEVRSFSEKYVNGAPNDRKGMRPLSVGSYWELFRNLHNYEDQRRLRVDESTLHPFLYLLFGWAKSRGLLGKQPRLWPVVSEFDVHGNANLRFGSQYSQAAIWEFLEAKRVTSEAWLLAQFDQLKTNDYQTWPLANLFKEFAAQQDRFEPNVYVVNMSSLGAPRIDELENKLFSQFVLGFLLSGMHMQNKLALVRALEAANILKQHVRYAPWEDYLKSVLCSSDENMYGLRDITRRVVQRNDVSQDWRSLRAQLLSGDFGRAREFFNKLRNLVFQEKLAEAHIGLAVIDEVHNWKGGKHNAQTFQAHYAPVIRSKLIMSATPFQVEEGEMERVFNFVVRPGGKSAEVLARAFGTDGGLMRTCLHASNQFAHAWKALSMQSSCPQLVALLNAQKEEDIRATAQKIIGDGSEQDTVLNFAMTLLAYRDTIETLQQTLRDIVIRHTKPRVKRDFRIGGHFHHGHPDGRPRPAMYPSEGYANEDAAMVNFIGMRLGQLVEREMGGKGKANARLLGGMSSSTRAYLKGASARMTTESSQRRYQAMFAEVLNNTVHPKVEATVMRAFDNFLHGNKTLIFCERVDTLDEIEAALTQKINAYHESLGAEGAAMARRSLMRRFELVDNLWWISLGDAAGATEVFARELVGQREHAAHFVQHILGQAGMKPDAKRIIRLLDLYLLAQSVSQAPPVVARWPNALQMFAGIHHVLTQGDSLARAGLIQAYVNGSGQIDDDRDDDPDQEEDDSSIEAIRVLDRQYRDRQNLWCAEPRPGFHQALWDLLDSEAGRLLETKQAELPLQAFSRIVLQLMTGLKRVALREDLIGRYEAIVGHRSHFERINAGLATMVLGHGETMLARTQRFIEGLVSEDGSISPADQRDSKRRSMWRGILQKSVKHVDILSGSVSNDKRVRLCASFNSPLLPDILVCSAIGSEGIDLHRHCANIIHHDMPWNPAKLEQRIGRLDRVNSLADPKKNIHVRIGIPFLANDYEKYQYDKVFSRAQKFEVLLGRPDFGSSEIDEEVYDDGAVSGTVREINDTADNSDEGSMVPLPESMIQFLKVDFTVA
ncbi:helicase-related protein [uncultured Herbaspirillum sp.]|uniref:helicase-related protein n=1 Tax=uncultured Herbaspirillum sp. TaxID=160236 RepID=UPI00258CB7B2|nr:helicase-related protein [uncultured Herbaspirillum sp.]